MAQGLITLLSLCVVMAAASFLAGVLPLALNLSSSRLRLISTIGMGVLVGTSLIVIIPEGVDTLYGSNSVHAHHKRDLPNTRHGVEWLYKYSLEASPRLEARGPHEPVNELSSPGPVIPDSESFPPSKTPVEPGVVGIMGQDEPGEHAAEEDEQEEAHHAWIGIALITGFILMFLIDKLPQCATAGKSRVQTHHIALNNLGRRFNLTTLDREEEAETFIDPAQPQLEPSNRSSATTIGLVIHAAADGVALGASSSTSNTGLSFVIFFAIMVHKAPAAFGLTSVLLKQGLSKRMARTHLLIFSLAAPAGAFLTWMLVHILGGTSTRSPQNSQWWTGVLLLFSAGTFLYVAMHSMQEITSTKHQEQQLNGNANGSIEARDVAKQEQTLSIGDLGAAVFGMILPLFLQIGHAH
ncbi:hypothetical protein H2198_007137 [Neophaeococcomyces mojaviensis]|uniref:Uncharacterized protein n=1 Tax=Neophaeococcomyces mojaviensis TaxID=3383035 RepID=A0ACC3A1E4_9EURO|nr:hypothetical protein H2198_007137 [Knufia sp. JES_112]